jgi:hypothetical protein
MLRAGGEHVATLLFMMLTHHDPTIDHDTDIQNVDESWTGCLRP